MKRKGGGSFSQSLTRTCVSCSRGNWQNLRLLTNETPNDTNQAAMRQLLQRIGGQLGIQKLADWYNVTQRDLERIEDIPSFVSIGPASKAASSGGVLSLREVLKVAYPDYPWLPTKFRRKGKWQRESNLEQAFANAEKKLAIEQPDDWYSVSLADLKQLVPNFPAKVGKRQLAELLAARYPNHKWDNVTLLKGRYAQQLRFEKAIASLFPGLQIKRNVKKEVGLINPDTGDFLELDVYIPSLLLAFEYQEKHHYIGIMQYGRSVEEIKNKDEVKKKAALEKGITLIIVPCWWDGTKESLIATIHKARPDVLVGEDTGNKPPIAEDIPPDFKFEKEAVHIEDIGQPVTPCIFTLSNVDPSNWWMFEKYDGVRGFWNPLKKAFYSKNGKRFNNIPLQIIEAMPKDMFLDGEIWFGRGTFDQALKVVHKTEPEIDWNRFKYMVFDIPNHPGTYEERYSKLADYFGTRLWGFMELANKQECKDMIHLEKYFQEIVDSGGEGIILRDPKAPKQSGRSTGYLKHKKYRDAEARVIRSTGLHQWECELPNGVRFTAAAATTEFSKKWNPQPGDIVSFVHRGYLGVTQKPKFPSIFRLRKDMTWEDVVHTWHDQSQQKPSQPERIWPLVRRPMATDRKPKGYWRDVNNVRQFFIGYAEEMGFDPLIPNNWDQKTLQRLSGYQGNGLLRHFSSYKAALVKSFPELQFTFSERRKKTSIEKGMGVFGEYAFTGVDQQRSIQE